MIEIPPGAYARPGTSLDFKTGTWRMERPVHDRRAAPCHAACPAGEDAQAYLAKVENGDLRGAWETIVAANPMPAITGRVCHHPCESACNRGHFDETITIHGVERFLGDEALREHWAYPVAAPGSLSNPSPWPSSAAAIPQSTSRASSGARASNRST
ncbi:MAG: hypothetical protein LC667_02805 [Thioalkalivibrio sp.]|nr:hypothetical protein [Thioalkalivibrio sp.]